MSPRSSLHSLSAFKSSSKFSEDFIFHLPEKSGIGFSIVIERKKSKCFVLFVFCRQSHKARSLSSFCASFFLRWPMCTALSSACICASIDWLKDRQAVMVVAREGLSALTLTAASTSGSMVRDVDTRWGGRGEAGGALPVIALNDDELSGYEENVLIGFKAERCSVAGVRVNLLKCRWEGLSTMWLPREWRLKWFKTPAPTCTHRQRAGGISEDVSTMRQNSLCKNRY